MQLTEANRKKIAHAYWTFQSHVCPITCFCSFPEFLWLRTNLVNLRQNIKESKQKRSQIQIRYVKTEDKMIYIHIDENRQALCLKTVIFLRAFVFLLLFLSVSSPCRSGCQKNRPAAARSLSWKATKKCRGLGALWNGVPLACYMLGLQGYNTENLTVLGKMPSSSHVKKTLLWYSIGVGTFALGRRRLNCPTLPITPFFLVAIKISRLSYPYLPSLFSFHHHHHFMFILSFISCLSPEYSCNTAARVLNPNNQLINHSFCVWLQLHMYDCMTMHSQMYK